MKRKNLLVLAASMLVLAACSNSQPAQSSPAASSAPAQSSSQPAASSSAQPSSSSARPSSSSSTPAPSSSTPAPSSSSSEASQVVTEEYYALPFGYSGKWEKGHTYSWTFDLENDISSVTFAFGAQMSYSSHSDRSFYTSSVNADSSDTFESDPANDGTKRIIVKVNDVEVEVTHKTYGELGLSDSALNYARVASFPVTAGEVKVELTTHPNAGYRLQLGGEARLYYDPADVGPATSVVPPVVSSDDSSAEPPVVSSDDSSVEPPVVSSDDSSAASSSELPVIPGTNITRIDGLVNDGEAAAKTDPGKIYYWFGAGANVTKCELAADELVMEYTVGGEWWSTQIFYDAPYLEAGDAVTVRLSIYSDAAGKITISGNLVDLIVGWNVVTLNLTKGANNTLLGMQLGYNGQTESFAGTELRIKLPEIYDAVNNYYPIVFKNGDDVLKDQLVREGKTVAAPKVTAPEGKVLEGWYDGDNAFDPAAPVTAAATYTARFVDASSALEVTYYYGNIVLDVAQVLPGSPAVFDQGKIPFGYQVAAWYTDSALTTKYEDAAITASTNLYAKLNVAPSVYVEGTTANLTPSNNADGSYKAHITNATGGMSWHTQVNFLPIPVGEAGKTYVLSLEYRLTGASVGGIVQASDENNGYAVPEGSKADLAITGEWTPYNFVFAGASFSAKTKLSFELGLARPAVEEAGMDLEVRGIWVSEAQPD